MRHYTAKEPTVVIHFHIKAWSGCWQEYKYATFIWNTNLTMNFKGL